MGTASSVMNNEALQELVSEKRSELVDETRNTWSKVVIEESETPETSTMGDEKPTFVHQSCDCESIRHFAEEMINHMHDDFLYKVKLNRIDVIEAERYISEFPDALFITDSRGESASSYAAFNRNAGLSCLFAKARGRRRSSAKMSPKISEEVNNN